MSFGNDSIQFAFNGTFPAVSTFGQEAMGQFFTFPALDLSNLFSLEKQLDLKKLTEMLQSPVNNNQSTFNNNQNSNRQINIFGGAWGNQNFSFASMLPNFSNMASLNFNVSGVKPAAPASPNYFAGETTNPEPFVNNPNLTVQKVDDGKSMPYLVIAPKNVNPNEKLPVLMYLHGRGQVGKTLDDLKKHQYDPAVIMNNWDLKNFKGYIICPLLRSGGWNNKGSEQKLRNLYNNFASTHNIDKNKVAIAGASMGAQGTLYMANAMSDIFKKAAAFSPYNPGNLGNGMKIPTKAFVGSRDDRNSYNFANGRLKSVLGDGNVTVLKGQTHDSTPGAAFRLDSNNNKCSDILEWLFS